MMISMGVSRIEKHQTEKSATRSTSMVNRLRTCDLLLKLPSLLSSPSLPSLSLSDEASSPPFEAPATSLRRRVLSKMRQLSCTRIRVDNIEFETVRRVGVGVSLHSRAFRSQLTEPELAADGRLDERRSEQSETEEVTPCERARRSVGILGHLEERDELLEEEGREVAARGEV